MQRRYQKNWEDELKRVFAEVDTAGSGKLDLEGFTKLVLDGVENKAHLAD